MGFFSDLPLFGSLFKSSKRRRKKVRRSGTPGPRKGVHVSKTTGGYKVTGAGACTRHRTQRAAIREGRKRARRWARRSAASKAELYIHHRGGGMTRSSYKKDPYLPKG